MLIYKKEIIMSLIYDQAVNFGSSYLLPALKTAGQLGSRVISYLSSSCCKKEQILDLQLLEPQLLLLIDYKLLQINRLQVNLKEGFKGGSMKYRKAILNVLIA